MPNKSEGKTGLDTRLAKSVGHPTRIEAIRILNERTASPSQLARALGQGVSHVSYHVQELSKYGCVELVRTEPRRGAVEHFYRATQPSAGNGAQLGTEETSQLPKEERAEVSAASLQMIIGEALGALRSGSFAARPDSRASWISLHLDEDGWGEVSKLMADTLKKVDKIDRESAKRINADGGESSSAMVSLIAFERSDVPDT